MFPCTVRAGTCLGRRGKGSICYLEAQCEHRGAETTHGHDGGTPSADPGVACAPAGLGPRHGGTEPGRTLERVLGEMEPCGKSAQDGECSRNSVTGTGRGFADIAYRRVGSGP